MAPETASLSTELLVDLTVDIVSAHVRKNAVKAEDLASLIRSVHEALALLASGPKPGPVRTLTPPVPIKRTITPDYLISLEDGRRYKALKRHLTRHGLTPAAYRAKWGLPPDYPMVAPNYARRRAEIARQTGLGVRPAA
jgi:predicted transcriptional regulator